MKNKHPKNRKNKSTNKWIHKINNMQTTETKKTDSHIIQVIGLGITDTAVLSPDSEKALLESELIIGSERQRAVVKHLLSKKHKNIDLPKLSELQALLDKNKQKRLVIFASGDPLFLGIGHWLISNIGKEKLHFHPAVSSIQAACHFIGLSLQHVDVLSLHGQSLEKIRTQLRPQQHLMILSDQHSQPKHLAQECLTAAYTEAVIWVCEKMG